MSSIKNIPVNINVNDSSVGEFILPVGKTVKQALTGHKDKLPFGLNANLSILDDTSASLTLDTTVSASLKTLSIYTNHASKA